MLCVDNMVREADRYAMEALSYFVNRAVVLTFPRERVDSWKHEQGRYGVEIMIESLFRDRTVSWVRIVNGINKYVIETSQEIPVARVENRGTGRTCREG